MAERVHGVVVAGGAGTRFGAGRPKQFLRLGSAPVVIHSLRVFEAAGFIRSVTVVLPTGDPDAEVLVREYCPAVRCVPGGATRGQSVLEGLESLCGAGFADDWVAIHDAARPCLSPELLARLVDEGTGDSDGAILAVPVSDTLKREDGGGRIAGTLDRDRLWAAQTPQLFPIDRLRTALDRQLSLGACPTDEASVMEAAGARPRLVEGSLRNIKITVPGDLGLAAAIIRAGEAK